MPDGWNPTRDAVELLIEAAAGNINAEEYKVRVLASVATRHRRA